VRNAFWAFCKARRARLRVHAGKPWRVCLYLDERANPAQREALAQIFLGRPAGTALRNLAAAIGEVYAVRPAKIETRTHAPPVVHARE